MQKSYYPRSEELTQRWVQVDLAGKVLGRVATEISILLRGKHRPTFTPGVDFGDYVVAVNASQIRLTGKKLTDKMYYHHTGFRGGIKSYSAGRLLETKPEELIRRAVKGMLPKNKMQDHFMKKLKIYAGPEHPHQAQFAAPAAPVSPAENRTVTAAPESKPLKKKPAAPKAAPQKAPKKGTKKGKE